VAPAERVSHDRSLAPSATALALPYLAYRTRQVQSQLRAAECQIDTVRRRQCLQFRPADAPIVTPA
jgi:hypothetical protein